MPESGRSYKLKGNAQRLLPNIKVWACEYPEYLHCETILEPVLSSECLDFVENDQLYLRKFSKSSHGAHNGRNLRCCPPPYCRFEVT